MKYGKNLNWLLAELANAEPEQIETGVIEVVCENEQGQEGSANIDIFDLVGAAKNRITELEKAINETIGFIESTNSLKDGDGGESLRLLKDVISTNS